MQYSWDVNVQPRYVEMAEEQRTTNMVLYIAVSYVHKLFSDGAT